MDWLIERGEVRKEVGIKEVILEDRPFVITDSGKTSKVRLHKRVRSVSFVQAEGDNLQLEKNIRLRRFNFTEVEDTPSREFVLEILEKENSVRLRGQAEIFTPALGNQAKRAQPKIQQMRSPMSGKVLKVLCQAAGKVEKGEVLFIIEAMKMENKIFSAGPATVKLVNVKEGDSVNVGQVLIVFA